jgi:hypothetical protein
VVVQALDQTAHHYRWVSAMAVSRYLVRIVGCMGRRLGESFSAATASSEWKAAS